MINTKVIRNVENMAPCPFCRQNRLQLSGESSGWIDGSFVVLCINDNCSAIGPRRATQEQAINAWNAWVNLKEVSMMPSTDDTVPICTLEFMEPVKPRGQVFADIQASYSRNRPHRRST